MRTRWYWAWRAFWFALTKQHPISPIVLQPGLTVRDLNSLDVLSPHVQTLLREIKYYEDELELFRAGDEGGGFHPHHPPLHRR